jgi:hypothetical protein
LGSLSGAVRIAGLPFIALDVTDAHSTVNIGLGTGFNITAGRSVTGFISPDSSEIILQLWDSAGGTSTFLTGEYSDDGGVTFSADYIAA